MDEDMYGEENVSKKIAHIKCDKLPIDVKKSIDKLYIQ